MTKNLIIFGAGASYGSDNNKSILPPLSKDLFSNLLSRYNDLKDNNIVQSLSVEFEKNFEQGVLKLFEKAPHFLSVFQRCMAHYFFQYGTSIPIMQSNLYFQLAHKIKNQIHNTSLVTLNYERILEFCFTNAGINLICNDKSNQNSLELCLPHGSCHLFCDGVRASSTGVTFSAMNVTTNGNVIALSNSNEFEQRIREDAMPPVMSYFEPSKMSTSGANFIISQRNRFKELVTSASNIVIIGIKVRENDEHIWNSLKNASGKITYCSGIDGKEFDNWRIKNSRNDKVLNGYFSDEFENICKVLGI